MKTCSVVVFCVVGLMTASCGSPNRTYKIAIDTTPALSSNLPASCFLNSQRPTTNLVQAVNVRDGAEWVIWDGPEGKQFLDITGSIPAGAQLGNSPALMVGSMIESSDSRTFAQTITETDTAPAPGQAIATVSTKLTINFDDLGSTARGTISIISEYACAGTNCPNPAPYVSVCQAVLPFVGRRIDVQNEATHKS
ncbi:MAG: hypothetical protein ACOZIN_06890 [Myxococcota bacterium]